MCKHWMRWEEKKNWKLNQAWSNTWVAAVPSTVNTSTPARRRSTPTRVVSGRQALSQLGKGSSLLSLVALALRRDSESSRPYSRDDPSGVSSPVSGEKEASQISSRGRGVAIRGQQTDPGECSLDEVDFSPAEAELDRITAPCCMRALVLVVCSAT
jgi:hypothetical protein